MKPLALFFYFLLLSFHSFLPAQDCVELQFMSACAMEGDTICVPLKLSGMETVLSFQTTLSWNDELLQFEHINNTLLPDFGGGKYAVFDEELTLSWLDQNVAGIDIPPNGLLLEVCFLVLGETGTHSPLIISGALTPTEVTDPELEVVPVSTRSGTFRVANCQETPLQITETCSVRPTCADEPGLVSVQATGGTPAYSFYWSGPNGFIASGPEINPDIEGWYYISVADQDGNSVFDSFLVERIYPEITAVETTQAYCPDGGSIDPVLPGNDLTDYSYQWDTGEASDKISGLEAGDYGLTITNAYNCAADTIISVQDVPEVEMGYTVDCSELTKRYDLTVTINGPELPYEVIWNNGSDYWANPTAVITGRLPGMYYGTVQDSDGCTFPLPDTFELPGISNWPFEDYYGCTGEMIEFAIENYGEFISIQWSPANGFECQDCTENTFTLPDVYGDTDIMIVADHGLGCPDTLSSEANLFPIFSDPDCVWPGDANRDGVADHFDLLHFGLGYNEWGFGRWDIGLEWIGYPGAEHEFSTPVSQINYRYADADGNGLVNADDTLALHLNYGLTHDNGLPLTEETLPLSDPVPLYIVEAPIKPGNALSLPLVVGTETIPAENLYGLALSIEYDPDIIDPASLYFEKQDGWIGTENADLWYMVFPAPEQDRIDIAFTRIDGNGISGYGTIGHLHFNVQNNEPTQPMKSGGSTNFPLTINQLKLINPQEQILPVDTEMPTLIPGEALQTRGAETGIDAWPVPTTNELFVRCAANSLQALRLTDLHGRIMREVAFGDPIDRYIMQLGDLPAGTYFLHLTQYGQSCTRKIIIQ